MPKYAYLGAEFYSKDKFDLLLTQLKNIMDIKREEKMHWKYSGPDNNDYNYYF